MLCTAENAPKSFAQLELTFRADGKTVAVVPFQYGRGIDSLPEIPAKKGCSAAWPALDYRHLTASQTLDAVYTPYTSALTDGRGTLPEILVDGSFSSRAEVSHTMESVTFTDSRGTEHSADAYTVTVTDPDLREISYTVHYRLPEGMHRCDLWVETEDGWQQQESTLDGRYLLFSSAAASVTFCVTERASRTALWLGLALAAALALILLAVYLIRRRRGQTLRDRFQRLLKKRHGRKI